MEKHQKKTFLEFCPFHQIQPNYTHKTTQNDIYIHVRTTDNCHSMQMLHANSKEYYFVYKVWFFLVPVF